MARLTVWQLIFGGAGMFGLLATIIYTHKSYRLTARTTRAELRPYVGIQPVVLEIDGGKITLRSKIKNFGQTPAQDVRTSSGIGVLPYPLTYDPSPDFLGEPSFGPSKIVLFPSAETDAAKTEDIGTDRISTLKDSDTARIYLIVRTDYFDSFGEKHITKACVSLPAASVKKALETKSGTLVSGFDWAEHHNSAT